MASEQKKALRDVFRAALAPLTPAELNELVMEPYRDLVARRGGVRGRQIVEATDD